MDYNTIVWILLYPFLAFFLGILLHGYANKFIARIHRRVGPYWLQPFYDIIKLMRKKTNISHGYMHDSAMWLLLGGTILTLMFIPVPGFNYFSAYGDVLVIMYILLIPSLGMALGVGETANPNGSIGIARALMLLAGYDVAFALSFVGFAMANGTTSMYGLMMAQQKAGVWGWGIFANPFLSAAGYLALMGMLAKKPFEVFIAPAEIATGPMVEMGGKYLGMMMIQHAIGVFVELMIYINLFMGGARNWLELIVKLVVLYTSLLAVGSVFPRYKTDDAVKFMWKYPLALAVVGTLIVIF